MRSIKSFLAVAEHLSFRRAAAELRISQPALSVQIRLLEEEIGVQLFRRDRQKTALTYAGAVFRGDIAELTRRSARAAEKARRAAKGSIEFLRIGFISTATTAHVLPSLLLKFRASHPHVELTLQNILNSEQVTMVDEQALDLGFFRMPMLPHPRIDFVPVHREPHMLLLSADHPLAGKRTIRASDLRMFPFVMYSREHAPEYYDLIMRTLNANGVHPHIAQDVSEMYTLASLVSADIGIAIAPVSTRNYHLPRVVFRPLAWLPPADIAIGFRRDNAQPSCRIFIDMAREHYARESDARAGVAPPDA